MVVERFGVSADTGSILRCALARPSRDRSEGLPMGLPYTPIVRDTIFYICFSFGRGSMAFDIFVFGNE